MDYLIQREKEIIENTAVVEEERNGSAAELTSTIADSNRLSDTVRSRVQQLSVLDIIA